ncbi:uncharacterized protein LOC112567913 isoform X2 [Pomacea canaliculata]|uniref:uncharacterized protein LOC112567913 isoform X2 n=1 Tax=Pomacea canaliculata TaxID=400727 RepID=UPI000D739AAF|nr:uncharacterized protein LOC112567913 isoform X2 [Pomacea canaliculata]
MALPYILIGLLNLLLSTPCMASNCPIRHSAQTHYEETEVKENAWANFSYPLSGKSGKMLKNSDYNIEIKVCENGILSMACWCRCVPHNNILCRNEITESVCDADNSEMRLSLLGKRSYSDIVWEFFTQGVPPVVLKHTKLKVVNPPVIEQLTVNGKQESKIYVNETEKIRVFCSFSNGHPPVTIRLLEVGGRVSNSSNATKGRIELFFKAYRCTDVWHSVRCEGPSSELNRSVSILVKCPPQFSSVAAEDLDLSRNKQDGLNISIRSHTQNISKCEMKESSRQEVKKVECKPIGSPPDFNLTLLFGVQSWIGEGNWTLFLTNDVGTSEKTFLFKQKTALNDAKSPGPEEWKMILLIVSACLLGVTVFVAVALILCILKNTKRHESERPHRTRMMSARTIENNNDQHQDDIYNNVTEDEAVSLPRASSASETQLQESASGGRNPDGLIYGDLDFSNKTATNMIIGSESETQYADIHFAAAAIE